MLAASPKIGSQPQYRGLIFTSEVPRRLPRVMLMLVVPNLCFRPTKLGLEALSPLGKASVK